MPHNILADKHNANPLSILVHLQLLCAQRDKVLGFSLRAESCSKQSKAHSWLRHAYQFKVLFHLLRRRPNNKHFNGVLRIVQDRGTSILWNRPPVIITLSSKLGKNVTNPYSMITAALKPPPPKNCTLITFEQSCLCDMV